MLDLTTKELAYYPIGKNLVLAETALISTNHIKGTQSIYICYDSLTFALDAEHEIIHSVSHNKGQGVKYGHN